MTEQEKSMKATKSLKENNFNNFANGEVQTSMNGNNGSQVLTPQDVAERLAVKVSFINRELRNGKMKGFKVGKSWRTTQSALDEYCIAKINKGNEKRTLNETSKAKIQYQSKIRQMENLPNAVETMAKYINEMRDSLPQMNVYQRIAKVSKMKEMIQAKAEKEAKLRNQDEQFLGIGSKAYTNMPNMREFLNMTPEQLDEYFLQYEREQSGETAASVGHPSVSQA